VKRFEKMAGVRLNRLAMPGWTLPRSSGPPVHGSAYSGVIEVLAGIRLLRKVHVLGLNHNLQSSYGVTEDVVSAVSEWVGRVAKEQLA
jgi:hypothetical protein